MEAVEQQAVENDNEGGKTMKAVEHIEQELLQATQELQELQAEQGNLDEARRDAIEADHKERMKAAKSGGRIRSALEKRRSKVQEIRNRAEELPYEIHVARLRVAELRKEHNEAMLPDLQKEMEEAEEAVGPADEEFAEVQAKNAEVHARYDTARVRLSSVESAVRDASLELEELEKVQPVDIAMPENPILV